MKEELSCNLNDGANLKGADELSDRGESIFQLNLTKMRPNKSISKHMNRKTNYFYT